NFPESKAWQPLALSCACGTRYVAGYRRCLAKSPAATMKGATLADILGDTSDTAAAVSEVCNFPHGVCWRPGQYGLMIVLASSRHTSGANVVMADGVVRFVTSSIDVDTRTAAGTRKA